MTKAISRTLMTGFALATLIAPALAQAPPSVTSPPASADATVRDPKACAPSQQVNPSQPPSGTTGQSPSGSSQNLGDKLAQTDGVLCPPAGIDPEIHAPTPDTGRMPVIPPPGSPGGDPTLRPK
jgi:hypothetical protein